MFEKKIFVTVHSKLDNGSLVSILKTLFSNKGTVKRNRKYCYFTF